MTRLRRRGILAYRRSAGVVIDFTTAPAADSPLGVRADASVISDPAGALYTIRWDFGESMSPTYQDKQSGGDGFPPTQPYYYAAAGTYTITASPRNASNVVIGPTVQKSVTVTATAAAQVTARTPGARVNRSSTTISPAYPAVVAAGDYHLMVWGSTNSAATLSTLAGWTSLVDLVADNAKLRILGRSAAGGETGAVAFTQSNHAASAQMFGFAGAHATQPDRAIVTYATPAAVQSTFTIPTQAAVNAGSVLVEVAIANATVDPGFTPPAGTTKLADWLVDNTAALVAALVTMDNAALAAGQASGTRDVGLVTSRRGGAAGILLRRAA